MKQMKFHLVHWTLLLTALGLSAQAPQSALQQAEQMVAQRQYESAFYLLDQADPTNDNPAILQKKTDIVFSFFAQSIMHQVFSLKDLAEGENLDDVRVTFEEGNVFAFDVDSLTKRLLANDPDNCILLRCHRRYHEALLLDYGTDIWGASTSDSLCLDLLQQACASPCNDAESCYEMALFLGGLDQDSDAPNPEIIENYQRAISLCDTHWNALFNLGVMEYQQRDFRPAAAHMDRAYRGYRDSTFKSDAARALGILYGDELDMPDSAIYYFDQALRLDSFSTVNYVNYLSFLVNSNRRAQASRLLPQAWQQCIEGNNPFEDTRYVVGPYLESDYREDIVGFLEGKTHADQPNFEKGLAHFILGQITEDVVAANSHIQKAIDCFSADGAPDTFIQGLRNYITE